MTGRRLLCAAALLLALLRGAPARAGTAPPRLLPLPLGLGGHPGFFGPSPGAADLAAHLRGTVLFGTELPGAPALSMRWNLGASVSLWRWAEAGARFSGRWDLETRQHAPGPVELWLRAGPPDLGGAALQAVLEHAAGRGGFDEGGRLWTSTTNIGAAVAAQRWRFRFAGSLTYERAEEGDGAPATYQGLRASAGVWFAAAKAGEHPGLDVGGDALVRVGGTEGPRGPLDVAAVFAIGVRLVDDNGAAFRAGYGQGYGPGMPARFGVAGLGWSYGRGYIHERSTPALLDQLSDWLRAQWAQRTAPGFGALRLPPPALLPPPESARPGRPLVPPLSLPSHCEHGARAPARSVPWLSQRACFLGARLGGEAPPEQLAAGPEAPQEPGPPMPPGALAGPPPRAAGPRGAPRGPLRTGRGGGGYTDPDTRAQAEPPARTPPTVWTGGRPGPATMGPADAPPPPPSIPIRPQPPGPLPPGMRPADVPPFLRPERPSPADTAPRPSAPPASASTEARQSTGSAAAGGVTPAPSRRLRLSRSDQAKVDAEATDARGDVRCQTCGTVTTPPTPRTRGSTVAPTERQYDHLIPVARGGNSRASNFEVKCAACNNEKGSQYVPPWTLRPVPQTPRLRPRR